MTGLDLTLPSGADPMNLPPQQHLGLEPTPLSPTTLAQPDEHPAYLAERQRLEQTRQAREDAFLADFRLSLKSNPKAVGEAQQAARKLGLPTAAVEANIDVAKEVLRQRDMRDRELWKTHPILMRTLQDREFLRLAHDDLDNLAATDTVFAMMGRKWEAGRATNERGYLGARMAAGLVSQEDKDRRAELDAIIQNAARDSGFIASTTEVLGQMSGTLPQALAAGGAAAGVASLGGPVTAGTAFTYGFGTALFTQSALIEGGNAYLDMLDQGVEQDKAAVLAMGVGLVNGALELAGAKVVAKPFQMATRNIVRRAVGGLTQETAGKAFGSFVVEYAKSVGAEVSTEVLQEVTNMVAEAVGRPDGQPEPSWGEIRGRLGDIFTKTAQSMSVLGLPGSVAHYYSQAQRASQALDRAEAFQRQVELSAESKVREAHPEQFEGYAQLVSEQAKATDLFVGSEKFVQAMDAAGVTRADLQAKQPELFQQLEKAEENADLQMDVVIRNSAFQAKLAKTPLGDALMEHVRFEQDGMSMAEAQEWVAEQKNLAKEAGSLVAEKRELDTAFQDSAAKVEESLYQQIQATKTLPAKESRAAAQFYRDFVVTQAARRGLLPEEFQARYPLRVQKGDGTRAAGQLEQRAVDTPEFKAWFGDSKVVDAEGKPLVVYHGTARAFDTFNVRGLGAWFTSQPDVAGSYSEIATRAASDGAAQVIPVHLSIKNPAPSEAIFDAYQDAKKANVAKGGAVAFVREKLEAQGYDGIVDGKGVDAAYVAFRPEQIKSVNNRGTFDPNDPNILRQDAKGGFIPESMTMLLHEKADVSTFLHEAAHAFLTIYGDLAAQGDAQATADLQTLLDWFGVKDVAAWNAMTLEEQRKHHEKFAYSFEGYLFDGTAPSEAMQGLFDRFKVWLRRVYKTIRDSIGAAYRQEFGEDLPILTGEVRGVMDRMLASEEAIAEAEAVRSMAPLFQTQEQSGMDDAKWAAYKQEAERARDAAVASLEKDSLRQMQWLDRARGRVLKQLQREHDTVRKRVRKEVATEVAARPAVRADRWLRTGKMPNEDGTTAQGDPDPNHKLDKAAVAAILGKDADKAQAYVRAEGGLSPDAVAEQIYGPDASGETMLRELIALPPLGEAIDARTDERMLAEHSELADPEVREAAVERALHNEARARFVAAELRHLAGATQPVRLMLAAAKAAAKETIQGLPVREVSAKRFAQAEARAARQAMEALRKGDSALAVQWQQKRLLQHALATEAGKVQAEVDKALRGFQKLRLPDEKVAKTRSVPLVNAARWILSRYNLGTPGQQATAENALEAVQAYDPALFERLKPLLFAAQKDGQDYRNLSVEQFRDLAAKVDGLWFQAKRGNEIIADGKAIARDAVKQEILATLAPRLEGKGGKPRALTKGEKNKRSFGSIRAALTHVESLVLKWDGGKPGALHRYLFHLIRDPFDSYQLEKNRLVKAVFDRATQLPNLHGAKIDASQPGEIAYTFKDRGELISALLHAGNKHNLEVNGLGRGWFARPAKGQPVDVSGFWRFVQRAVDEGKLTLADLYFVQYVWDLFEKDLKPTVQKAHFENYGYYMDEVEAVPFALRFGGETVNFRGGYYPAKADPDWVDAQPGQVSTDGVTESAGAFLDRHPSTGKGFTITRVEGVERPLLQDIRLVAQAFDEELRFAYLQRPGRDISSLLNDPEIAAAIRAIDPNALQETFRPWLNDTMHNRVMAPGGHPVLNRFLVALRRNVGLATMFGNVPNALQQPTGLATAALYVPMRFLRASAANFARAPRETAARVTALSKFMRLRLENQIGQLVDDMDVLVEPTKLGQTQAWFRRNGYFLQRMFQNPVDIISWTAAFDQAVTEGKTEKQAVTWADTVVRRSQGSGTAADISKAERAGAIGRLLTQFGTFWLSQLNTVLGREGLPSQARAAAMAVGVAGVVAGAIAQALRGGWDDEDDDGALWDDVTGWAFSEAARTAASTFVPFVGPSAIQIATGERGGRFTPGASVGAVESAGRALRSLGRVAMDPERDLRGQDIKDAATLLSLLLGIPLTAPARPASYGFDMATGQVQPSGAVDAARGLVTGAVAPGTRQ